MLKRGTMTQEKNVSLVLLGIVSIVALAGMLLLLKGLSESNSTSGALTYAEKVSQDAMPWNTMSENCAFAGACYRTESDCGRGYILLYVDGYPGSCISEKQKGALPICVLTPFRFGSHFCSESEQLYSSRCVCPG